MLIFVDEPYYFLLDREISDCMEDKLSFPMNSFAPASSDAFRKRDVLKVVRMTILAQASRFMILFVAVKPSILSSSISITTRSGQCRHTNGLLHPNPTPHRIRCGPIRSISLLFCASLDYHLPGVFSYFKRRSNQRVTTDAGQR